MEHRIVEVHKAIVLICRNLERLGFQFDHPESVCPGPERDVERSIADIEREAGPIPRALKLFWTRIGSVDLSGHHPDWTGCEYPDQLMVAPTWPAIEQLESFLSDREAREAANFPYLIPIAPDLYHKADVSGGMWYNIEMPSHHDDPPLNDERHQTTFLNYLSIAIRYGGFPGLEISPNHTWPINEITRA